VSILPSALIERTFRERIVLVGVQFTGVTSDQISRELDELALLVGTAGADVVARVEQRRDRPDAATFIGSGKVEELREVCLAVDSDTVVFDHELSPAQQRNLEKILGRTAIDRTAVILDIFGQNARSPEGKAQVELAMLQYRLPRLRREAGTFSQQGYGVGARGPGETQLETDRRKVLDRISTIKRELKQVSKTRAVQRQSRARGRHREVTLVGYTNAGKSTVLNALTDAGVSAENRLFETLDPRTRQLRLPGGETVLVTDTVGFISKLPHELVDAFKSTLDSVRLADLLIHVVDGAREDAQDQIDAVRTVLEEIGAEGIPELLIVNKSDADPEAAEELAGRHGAMAISAITGDHVADLISVIGERLRSRDQVLELHLPASRGDLIAAAHREGEVIEKRSDGDEVVVKVLLDNVGAARFRTWAVSA
jgi:GTPase